MCVREVLGRFQPTRSHLMSNLRTGHVLHSVVHGVLPDRLWPRPPLGFLVRYPPERLNPSRTSAGPAQWRAFLRSREHRVCWSHAPLAVPSACREPVRGRCGSLRDRSGCVCGQRGGVGEVDCTLPSKLVFGGGIGGGLAPSTSLGISDPITRAPKPNGVAFRQGVRTNLRPTLRSLRTRTSQNNRPLLWGCVKALSALAAPSGHLSP